MTRTSKDHFRCIVCGGESIGTVICHSCSENEMSNQKSEPSSITAQQLWYINKNFDIITTQEAVKIINPDCVWDLDNLSCQEAKRLISTLHNCIDTQEEKGKIS